MLFNLATSSLIVLSACVRQPPITSPSPAGGSYDVIIENGRIVDGTGNPWMYGDVGIRGDRIAAVTLPRRVANGVGKAARRCARSRRRTRLHRHSGAFVGRAALAGRPRRQQGDAGRDHRDPRRGDDARAVERQHGGARRDRRTWNRVRAALQRSFTATDGFGAWLDAMSEASESRSTSARTSARRRFARTRWASRRKRRTDAQLDTMRAVVRDAMRDGAFGISSALIYPPGSYASTRELIEMAKAMAPYHGGYITHMRSEDDSLLEAMDEAFRIAREGGVRFDIYHLKASDRRNWPKAPAMVAKIDSARAAGLDVGATMYPYPYSGNNLGECIPDWAAEEGKLFANLRDPATRTRILREMADPNGDPLCQREGPSAYMIADFRKPENTKYEGKRLSDISTAMGKPWPETIVELMLSEGRDLSKINFTMSEDNVRMQIQKPWVIIGTDAGGVRSGQHEDRRAPAHRTAAIRASSACYVREQKLFTLEEAVRKMSGAVAARLGLRDRGLLREGMFADVVVFDDKTIIDLATPEKPHQISRGVEQVFVNGVQVLRDGKHTGATPGKVVRGPSTQSLRSCAKDRFQNGAPR